MNDIFPPRSTEVPAIDVRPEIRLLLCCARTRLTPEAAEEMRTLLKGHIDWQYLLELALQHRVMPLLYWNLHATCPEAVPKTILVQLQRDFHAITRRNLHLARELLTLLSMLEAHGIPAIPYKGPVLAVSVYGNLALRQFKDLDILVREQDAVRAKDLLLSQGYRPKFNPSAVYESLFRHFRQAYDLMREDDQLILELHWHIISWPVFLAANSALMWTHVEQVSLAGKQIHTLAPEDVLAVLCVHGAKHRWQRLAMICDIAELLRTYPEIRWGRVLERAHQLGGARTLHLGLLLAQELLGASLPEELSRQVQADPRVQWLADRVRRWLFTHPHGLLRSLHQHAFYLGLAEHLQDRLWCGLRMTPRMFARVIYYVITPRLWRHD
jgi:hypothetical protein